MEDLKSKTLKELYEAHWALDRQIIELQAKKNPILQEILSKEAASFRPANPALDQVMGQASRAAAQRLR